MSYELEGDPPRGPVFIAALRGAATRVPIWLFCWLVPFLLAATAAAPWVAWFERTTEHRYDPGNAEIGAPSEVFGMLRETFRFDHGKEMDVLRRRTGELAAAQGLMVMLFGAFAAGGWLQVFLERTSGHSMRRFLWGGSRYFWRFFRVWLLSIAALALVSWVMLGWPWKTLVAGFLFGAQGGETELLVSEWTAVWLGWLQSGLYAAAFALVLVWGDYTRTRLALQDTRSAVFAGLASLGLLFAHPIRVLRPMAFLLLLEMGALWACGALSSRWNAGLAEGGAWLDVVWLFLLGQLALFSRVIVRGARYHAAVQVSRGLVPPLLRPDPWAARVGGPGGPQYPIDPGDDYGVSL